MDTVVSAGVLDADEPENAILSPDGQYIYVNDNSFTSKFSTITFECLGFVDTGYDGHGIAISSDGTKLYADGGGVVVIDSGTMSATDTLLAADGYYLETSKDGAHVYGVNEGRVLSVIDAQADTLIANITLSLWGARRVTTSQSGDLIFVAGYRGLTKLDAQSLNELGTISGFYQSVVIAKPNGAVPVELTSFTASLVENEVVLEWQTQTETNNYGFEIERMGTSNWVTIGFVEGKGTTTQPQYYEFIDQLSDNLLILSTLTYRLKQIDSDGSYKYSQTLTVNLSLPKTPQLYQNYPNPFNPTTTILYSIPNTEVVTLKVYDLLGREVQTLVNQFQKAGTHSINFNAGRYSSGVYFYKLYLRNRLVKTKKMVLIQ